MVAELQGCRGWGAADLVDGAGDSLGEAEQRRPVLVGRALHAEGREVRVAPAVALHAHGAHGQQGGRDGRPLPRGARGSELCGDGVVRRCHVPARPRRQARQALPCASERPWGRGGTAGGGSAGPEAARSSALELPLAPPRSAEGCRAQARGRLEPQVAGSAATQTTSLRPCWPHAPPPPRRTHPERGSPSGHHAAPTPRRRTSPSAPAGYPASKLHSRRLQPHVVGAATLYSI